MLVDDSVWLVVAGLSNEGVAQIDEIADNYNKHLV